MLALLGCPSADPRTRLQPLQSSTHRETPRPEGSLARLSHSDLLQTRYTCTTNLSLDKAYPAVAAERGRTWRLDVPAGVHWLFYGPSYLGQVFSTLVAANDERITRIENLDADDLLRELPPSAQRQATCTGFPDYCGVLAERQLCNSTVAFGIQRVTLDNGAVLVGVHNNELLQRASSETVQNLVKVVQNLKPDHAFYQHPHDFETYEGVRNAGCAEHQLQRGKHWRRHESTDKLGKSPMDNMCITGQLHTESDAHMACVGKSALWDAIRRHTPHATIVAPAVVAPASKGVAHARALQNDIYYTQPVVKKYNCGTFWDLAAGLDGVGYTLPPDAIESWLLLGHQCVVLTDGRDEFLGGPVMEIAEDLLRLASS